MNNIDEFSKNLIEEAKRFLEKANDEKTVEGRNAFIHAAIVLGFCALEAYINAISDELLLHKKIPLLEKAILSERDINLTDGEFNLTKRLKIYRLEDRIQFLYRKYSGKKIDKQEKWWSEFKAGLQLRNNIAHPKKEENISLDQAKIALQAIITTIDILFRAIYKKGFPPAEKGLMSLMSF